MSSYVKNLSLLTSFYKSINKSNIHSLIFSFNKLIAKREYIAKKINSTAYIQCVIKHF